MNDSWKHRGRGATRQSTFILTYNENHPGSFSASSLFHRSLEATSSTIPCECFPIDCSLTPRPAYKQPLVPPWHHCHPPDDHLLSQPTARGHWPGTTSSLCCPETPLPRLDSPSSNHSGNITPPQRRTNYLPTPVSGSAVPP